MRRAARWLRFPLLWAALATFLAAALMPRTRFLFAALFPELDRPVYEQDSFLLLTLAHLELVGISSLAATVLGLAVGILVTRPSGSAFRGVAETLVAMGQTAPPVAVLALAVPSMGFGQGPALLALTLYGVLPILRNTLAGLESVPQPARDAAEGMGMRPWQVLTRVELPLAAPVILAGIRTSAIVNLGTAAIASTVGARTLGSPIILGLSGSNTAYVLQGAFLLGLLAILLDLAFTQLGRRMVAWRSGQ